MTFRLHDLRAQRPEEASGLDLVLCRNLAFTYFGVRLRDRVSRSLRDALRDGGWLVVGRGEEVGSEQLSDWTAAGRGFYRRRRDLGRPDPGA